MKKLVSLLLAMALVLSLCAFAQAEEITLRVLLRLALGGSSGNISRVAKRFRRQ